MDKYERRRQNLAKILADQCSGKIADLAKKIDRSDSYVTRMLYPDGKSGKKRIGEDLADLISKTFGFDISIDDAATPIVQLAAVPSTTDRDKEFAMELAALVTSYAQANDEGRRSILRFVKNREMASDQRTATNTAD
jgi:hypothetical protein